MIVRVALAVVAVVVMVVVVKGPSPTRLNLGVGGTSTQRGLRTSIGDVGCRRCCGCCLGGKVLLDVGPMCPVKLRGFVPQQNVDMFIVGLLWSNVISLVHGTSEWGIEFGSVSASSGSIPT